MKKSVIKGLSFIIIFLVLVTPLNVRFVYAQDEGSDIGGDAGGTSDAQQESPQESGPIDSGADEGADAKPGDESEFTEGERGFEETEDFKEEFRPDYGKIEEFAKESDIKEKIMNCEGRHEINSEGKLLCIYEPEGFMKVECPSKDISCGGVIKYIEKDGCEIPVCEEKLNLENLGDDERCALEGGEKIKGECVSPFEETLVIDELKPVSEDELSEIRSRLNEFSSNLDDFLKKIKGKEGEEFEDAKSRLEAVLSDIELIKSDLSGEVTETQRKTIIENLQKLKTTTNQILVGIVKGEKVDDKYLKDRKMEQLENFGEFTKEELLKLAEEEKTALELVRSCERYDNENFKEFVPPEPGGFVVNVKLSGLDDKGRCLMELNFKDGESVSYSIPNYKRFNPEKSFFEADIQCSGACDRIKQMMESHKPQGENEKCIEDCLKEACPEDITTLSCMGTHEDIKIKCEDECGLKKGPSTEGMGKEENCIFECVQRKSPGTMCGPSAEGEQGSAVCQECAQECVGLYEGPCLNDEQKTEKERECESRCEHCYGEPVMGDSGEGYECIADVRCEDASGEFGDEPGSGPGITGEAISNADSENIFTKFVNWLKGLFSFGKKSSEGVELSEGDSSEDITSDLLSLSAELESISKDLS